VSVEETECGTEPPVVDEFDDREQVVESILQWRTGEHEREGRSQALRRLRRLRLPVLDALALVQNDQIPLCSIDCEDVTQHLLVIANSEETPVPVLSSPLFGAPQYDLRVTLREAENLAAPLGFDRSRANDQNFADARFASEQLRYSDALKGLPEAHVIRQDCPACADSKGDTVQLVGQDLNLQKGSAQRMGRWIASDFGTCRGDALLQKPGLNVFLGIRIDLHRDVLGLKTADALKQIRQVGDRSVTDRHYDSACPIIEPRREQHAQLHLLAVRDMHADFTPAVWPIAHRIRKSPADLLERMENVLAGAERVLTEIWA